jgi:hypothetical protein
MQAENKTYNTCHSGVFMIEIEHARIGVQTFYLFARSKRVALQKFRQARPLLARLGSPEVYPTQLDPYTIWERNNFIGEDEIYGQ